ncbi:MAG: DNA polymerase III subunit beta [Fimbriimonas ginsengisoli]|uniref:Beta sliding clamp n=1 Tax=Fimbriimonas ginsengisoli TaxID=1005039 RepID=A0A931LTC2_FIMGI|nr:DNA polymerase III subunit beta [Fimbriimonas ginsengisoli]
MKFDCPRKEFFEAVSQAGAAVGIRSAQPLLLNLRIEASNGGIKVLGCDGEMWVERSAACMVHEPGTILLPARLLVEIVSSMPDGDVQLRTLDGQGVMLQQDASEYRMLSLDPADFPEPPDYGGEAEITLPMGELRHVVDSVSFAVSQDQHRQVLTGVLFNYNGKALTLVATDTHFGVGRLGVEAGGARVVSQLLAGAFPNWERVVPGEVTRTWSLEVDQLRDRLKRANILARDNANRVRFSGKGDQILISARSEERGEAKEEVAMVADNGDLDIAFNCRYVIDALEPILGHGVRVEMTESSRPAVFKPADDGSDYFCVIMPMALA